MTSVDLREIRRRLPYGSLARIAETVGIRPEAISNVFNYGWYPQYHSRIVEAALSILNESNIDPNVLDQAKEMGLTKAHSVFVPKKPKKKKNPGLLLGEDYDDDVELLKEFDFDDLCGLVEAMDLDIDLDDYEPGFLTTEAGRMGALREAILYCYYDF